MLTAFDKRHKDICRRAVRIKMLGYTGLVGYVEDYMIIRNVKRVEVRNKRGNKI